MTKSNESTIVSVSDRLNIKTCTVREAKELVRLCIATQHVACLVGSTGIGKTQSIQQLAREMNAKLLPLFLAHREREDIIGIPFPDEDKKTYKFLIEKAVYEAIHYDGRVIIVLDEFNRADKGVLNAGFTMIEDRAYGSIKLPDNVSIVCCMNPSDEGYLVNGAEKDPAFRRRLCFVHVVANHATWVDFATNEGRYHKDVISFIRANPVYLDDPGSRIAGKVGPNPAAWEKVSQTIQYACRNGNIRSVEDKETLKTKIAGHVGIAAMVQFMEYALRTQTERIYPEDFLGDESAEAVEKLKMLSAARKNDVIIEALHGVALLIATTTPPVNVLIKKLGSMWSVMSTDMVQAFAVAMRANCKTLGKENYLDEVSAAAGKDKKCQEALNPTTEAIQRITATVQRSR